MDWIKKVNSNTDVVVYDKGIKDSSYIKLKNIGREPHTFFHHIIQNYDNLSEWTIFCQDDPIEHVPNWLEIINADEEYWKNKASFQIERTYHFFIAGVYTEYGGTPDVPMVPIWERIFKDKYPGSIQFVPACNFIAHRDSIHYRSKSFYENLNIILETEERAPWVIERFIIQIFNQNRH
jgi:hypothetical protein